MIRNWTKKLLLTNFQINQFAGLDNCICLFCVKIGSLLRKSADEIVSPE